MKLFIYGTVRKGFHNHHYLEGARYIGRARTKAKYSLYANTLPYLVKDPVCQVKGELYEVDNTILTRMDILEGEPECYIRLLDTVILDHPTGNGKEHPAYIYFYPRKTGKLIPSGDFADWKG
jgi:gamma-glutamylaminecyclotransferase